MKLTEKDIAMFKGLYDTQLGSQLTDYLNRVKMYVGYVGNLKPGDSVSDVRKAIEVLDKHLIDKLTKQNKQKDVETSQFE
jgi:hypothetical protein